MPQRVIKRAQRKKEGLDSRILSPPVAEEKEGAPRKNTEGVKTEQWLLGLTENKVPFLQRPLQVSHHFGGQR